MCKHEGEKIVLPAIGKAQCLDCGKYIDKEEIKLITHQNNSSYLK
jgi:hypothetical protein